MSGILNPFLGSTGKTLLQMITDAGLTTGLVLCLDAGDGNSYDGTSQTWIDASGNSNNFFRGTTSSAQASDPTFNGSADGKSVNEYFSFDGADLFQDTASQTLMNSWHKNNAIFTIIAAIYAKAGSLSQTIIGNDNFTGFSHGLSLYQDASDNLSLSVANASALVLDFETLATFSLDAWNFSAAAINEATGASGLTLQINATQESFNSTYSSPSTTNPDNRIRIGDSADTIRPFVNGSRIGCLAAWSSKLSNANLSTLYSALSQRYGF